MFCWGMGWETEFFKNPQTPRDTKGIWDRETSPTSPKCPMRPYCGQDLSLMRGPFSL